MNARNLQARPPSPLLRLAAVLSILGSLGCPRATEPATSGSQPAPPDQHALREVLGPADVFEVRVYGEPDLSGTFRLEADGSFVYPFLGLVEVRNLTASELAEGLRAGLADGYLREPQVTVFVTEFNSRKISVLGEVARPGRYRYRTGMTLVEAVAEAGGTTERAVLQSIRVTRKHEQGELSVDVAFKDITRGDVPDFPLLPGDIVFVAESAVK